jgi:hypothetical protein
MRALFLNCTLKPSPAESNTEALARVVMDALARQGVESSRTRPGWAGPRDEGRDWSHSNGRAAAANLAATARALAERPLPAP